VGGAVLTYQIEKLLLAWRFAALAEWGTHVTDEPGNVEHFFDAVGWNFHIKNGYQNNEKFAWCGIFAGAMGLEIGHYLEPGQCVPVFLDPDVAKFAFPSTRRLVSAGKWAAAGVSPPTILRPLKNHEPGLGFLSLDLLKPGMTCTVGNGKKHGTHIVIVDKINPESGTVDTIEGNAHGELGDGSWGEGVVRRRGEHARPFEEFRRAILLDPIQHFDDLTRGDS